MPNYIEYELSEDTTILIEAPEDVSPALVRAARERGEAAKVKASKTFVDAIKDVKTQARLLLEQIEELQVNEAEIKFGINTVGELGNMAIGKLGVGVNYEVILKWKKTA